MNIQHFTYKTVTKYISWVVTKLVTLNKTTKPSHLFFEICNHAQIWRGFFLLCRSTKEFSLQIMHNDNVKCKTFLAKKTTKAPGICTCNQDCNVNEEIRPVCKGGVTGVVTPLNLSEVKFSGSTFGSCTTVTAQFSSFVHQCSCSQL